MKRRIKVTGPDGKSEEKEVEIPNKGHFEAQLRYRAAIHRPKKGKGSFKRSKKIEEEWKKAFTRSENSGIMNA